jgi:transposase
MVRRKVYSLAFKRMVVQEYLTSDHSSRFLTKKYGIRSPSAIQKWMRSLGYEVNGCVRRPKFVAQIEFPLAKDKKQATPQQLQQKIRELERQLEDEKLRSEAFSRIIDKTEKELKISIRKKPNTK